MIRTLFIVLIGAVVLAVVGLLVGGHWQEPDFSGGSFTHWLKRSGTDARVDEAVAREGAVLVPELIELIEWQPSASERASRRLYEALPESWQYSFRLLNVAEADAVRLQALRALGGLGPEATSALPTVLAWAGASDETGQVALTAALLIAPASSSVTAQVLTQLLDASPARKEQAARALVAAEVPMEGGLLALMNTLNTVGRPSPALVAAIGLYGAEASRTVPRLARWLKDDELKRPVLRTLRRIGPASAIALAEVRPELTAHSPVIVEALDLVGRLGPAAASVLPGIKPLEESPAPMIRLLAASARGQAGVDLPEAVKALAREVQFQIPDNSWPYSPDHPLLRDLRFTPAQTAAWLLGQWGRKAERATPELILAMQGDDPRLSVIAAWSLWRISQDAELVVPSIRRGLRFTPDPVTQLIALGAAAELGAVGTLLEEELNQIPRLSLTLRRAARVTQDRLGNELQVPVLP